MNLGLKPIFLTSVVNYGGCGKTQFEHGEACLSHIPRPSACVFSKACLAEGTEMPPSWLTQETLSSILNGEALRRCRTDRVWRIRFFPLQRAVLRAGFLLMLGAAGLHPCLPLPWTHICRGHTEASCKSLSSTKNLSQEFPSRVLLWHRVLCARVSPPFCRKG